MARGRHRIIIGDCIAELGGLPAGYRGKDGRFVRGVRSSPKTEFKPGTHWRKPQPFRDREWLIENYVTLATSKVIGYRPTCNCPADEPAPCRVLDPFSGTGTTGQTACFLGHDYVGIELNPEYAAFADEWIAREPRWSLRKKVKATRKAAKPTKGQLMLAGL